ncbi:MAG: TIGR04084 family radical SAM/SPASM domain-containing protein [Candidatus Bathyarchaeota archaeon]|nr:TIGR04084 family radical SAM/SPASM domain-containing protein [Candidatus Bathyarchaeota archaeon]MDH5787220.1 TIGR04084 family radical SAM/SPASM domain-containing protein [Candidatus Bathyarchaeota archaeon]
MILTTECNLQCRYCFGEAVEDVYADFPGFEVDYFLPRKINYDLGLLDRFSKQDPECVLTFYGGEPLLCIDEIRWIMDNVKARHFLIQTNGLLLDRIQPEYVNRFHAILVSIDGDEPLTDFYRGKGTYRKVIDNMKLIRKNGFQGELIARMTVMEQTNIYKQVKWLLNNEEFSFSSVHWQLNAGFWGSDFERRNFKEWSEKCYNPEIRSLVKLWIDRMERKGTVLRLYPILGIADSLLVGEDRNLLRCGGGWINYAIQTDGHIVPCPTMWGMKDYYVGHISNADPLKLRKVFVDEPCTKCEIQSLCGGRCLYANITKRWKNENYGLVCNTVENLVEAVENEIPRIRQLIEIGKVSKEDFHFLKYNGCEIIP